MEIRVKDLMNPAYRELACQRLLMGAEEHGATAYGMLLALELSLFMVANDMSLDISVKDLSVDLLNRWHDQQRQERELEGLMQ